MSTVKWFFPPARGPNRSRWFLYPTGLSPAASAVSCALGNHRNGLELEVISGGQPRLNEMALDAAAIALGDGEKWEPARLPALFGELWP